jgi:hypothetical protein
MAEVLETDQSQEPIVDASAKAYNEVLDWTESGASSSTFPGETEPANLSLQEQGILPSLTLVGFDTTDTGSTNGEAAIPQSGKQVENDDGSTTTFDGQGRVAAVGLSDRNKTQFGYEGDTDKVTSIKETRQGVTTTYKLGADGHWYDDKGNDAGIKNVQVQDNGEYSFNNVHNEKVTHQTDGSIVTTDPQGRVTNIDTITGDVIHYTYDVNGELATIDVSGSGNKLGIKNVADGHATYTKDENGIWRQEDGKEAGMADVKIDANGNLSYFNTESRNTVVVNGSGYVSSVTDQSGKNSTKFEYTAGTLTNVTETRNGVTQTYVRNDKGEWTDENGKKTDVQYFSAPQFGGGFEKHYKGDKGFTVYSSTGAIMEYSYEAALNKITYPDGSSREFERNIRGEVDGVIEIDAQGNRKNYQRDWFRNWKDENGNPAPFTDFNQDKSMTGEIEYKNREGATISIGQNGQIKEIEHADGTVIRLQTVNGKVQAVQFFDNDDPRSDPTEAYVIDADGHMMQNGNHADCGSDFRVEPNGTVSYTDLNGNRITILPSGDIAVGKRLN